MGDDNLFKVDEISDAENNHESEVLSDNDIIIGPRIILI